MTIKPCEVCGTIHGPLESCPSFEKAERIRRMYSGGGISAKYFVKRYSKGDSSQRYTLRGDDIARMFAQADFAAMEARMLDFMLARFSLKYPGEVQELQDETVWASAEALKRFEAFCCGYLCRIEDESVTGKQETEDGSDD